MSTDKNASENELRWLADRWLEGDISEREAMRLKSLLRQSTAAVQSFLGHVELVTLLEFCDGGLNPVDPGELATALVKSPQQKTRNTAVRYLVTGACLSLLVAYIATLALTPNVRDPLFPVVAQVTRLQGVSYRGESESMRRGTELHSGDILQLENESRITLQFQSGATMNLDGPATLEFVSSMRVSLVSGRAGAEVPPQASGFYLGIPGGGIRDLGTRFAVAVDQELSQIAVIDGTIECELKTKNGTSERYLMQQGEAASINSAQSRFERTSEPPSELGHTIAAVYGITHLEGPAQFLAIPCEVPGSPGAREADFAMVFAEYQQVVLKEDLQVNMEGPGGSRKLRQGSRVDSFLIRYDPVDVPGATVKSDHDVLIQFKITFDRRILGVMRSTNRLQHSDQIFATPRVAENWLQQSPIVRQRRSSDELEDEVAFSRDGRSLNVKLQASRIPTFIDELRVIVESREIPRSRTTAR